MVLQRFKYMLFILKIKMRLNILIGGKAGQGINAVSQITAKTLIKQGYFVFNYRDYPSIIRGGHNFNVLSISDKKISSHESRMDGIIALDENTKKIHKAELKKEGFIIDYNEFKHLGINLNVALSGALVKILGLDKNAFFNEVKKSIGKSALKAAQQGYDKHEQIYKLKKLNNKLDYMNGSQAVAQGAINSRIDLYFAYPMTPATGVLHELAAKQSKLSFKVHQPESEIAVANMALGASFTGAKTMVGTSGGGFDLMGEALSFQGMSELPLVVYLASRAGPGTGVPTYSMQSDLDIALRSGHGEFPRVVIAPGDPKEAVEKANECFYLANKFDSLAVLLSDKHIAESEFSITRKINKILPVRSCRRYKASSYEHDKYGITTEDPKLAVKNADARVKRYDAMKKECKKFEMIKIHGKKNSKNLIIGWGSTKGAILDAIEDLDYKFLQVLYMKPLSDDIKKEMLKAKKIILIENNVTGQLGRLIREKTGIKISNRILKYNSRPFTSDELRERLR